MDWGLAASLVVAISGATWALRSKLSDVETALKVHVIEEASKSEVLTGRVIKLEKRRR